MPSSPLSPLQVSVPLPPFSTSSSSSSSASRLSLPLPPPSRSSSLLNSEASILSAFLRPDMLSSTSFPVCSRRVSLADVPRQGSFVHVLFTASATPANASTTTATTTASIATFLTSSPPALLVPRTPKFRISLGCLHGCLPHSLQPPHPPPELSLLLSIAQRLGLRLPGAVVRDARAAGQCHRVLAR